MSNLKKEDLILDSKIYVYCHKSESIKPAVIKSVQSRYYYDDYKNKFEHDNVIFSNSFGAVVNFLLEDVNKSGFYKEGDFFINFSDEFNKRDDDYVGFKTKEDAEFYRKNLIEDEIREKELEIENLKDKLKK